MVTVTVRLVLVNIEIAQNISGVLGMVAFVYRLL